MDLFGGDQEALENFIECLNPTELSIIRMHQNDMPKIRALIIKVQRDVDETAKSLAM